MRPIRTAAALLGALLALGACGAGETDEVEGVGETVEETMDELGTAAERAGEEIQEAAREVSEEVRGEGEDAVADTLGPDSVPR